MTFTAWSAYGGVVEMEHVNPDRLVGDEMPGLSRPGAGVERCSPCRSPGTHPEWDASLKLGAGDMDPPAPLFLGGK